MKYNQNPKKVLNHWSLLCIPTQIKIILLVGHHVNRTRKSPSESTTKNKKFKAEQTLTDIIQNVEMCGAEYSLN
jgi:hypothetical protein